MHAANPYEASEIYARDRQIVVDAVEASRYVWEMRQARVKLGEGEAVYHCVTRTVAGEKLLDRQSKEVLRKMLWQVAEFSGVEVLAYCIMSNHFHVLVRVSEDGDPCSAEELIRRYRILYGQGSPPAMMPHPDVMATILADERSETAEKWRSRLEHRMGDVSEFMKTLKQRFSIWYNRSHSRFGTLWAERFKSAIVENAPESLKVVAAYIDLNPVRAGLVEDPADYRWCSFGEAMAGRSQAQSGLAAVLGLSEWNEAASGYRMVIYGKGAVGRAGEQGIIPHKRVLEVLSQNGKVSRASLLRCRLRYLTDGAVLGSEAFVRDVGERLYLSPTKGATGTRTLGRLPSDECKDFQVWRRLRLNPVQ